MVGRAPGGWSGPGSELRCVLITHYLVGVACWFLKITSPAHPPLHTSSMRMRFLRVLFLVAMLMLPCSMLPDDELSTARRKALRMKSTRQLKEILKELGIKHKGLNKDAIKELAYKENALERWEELHPEKKKKPARSAEAEEKERIIAKLQGMGINMGGDSGQMANMDIEALRNLETQLGSLGALFGGGGGGIKFPGKKAEAKSPSEAIEETAGSDPPEVEVDPTADHDEL